MDDLGFELLASSLRADSGDLRAYVEALAAKLEGALPTHTVVERKGGGLFSRSKRVSRITVDMGDIRYELLNDDGRIEATRCKAVRGIVVKSERIGLNEWTDDLSQELAAAAQGSDEARLALERLLGQ